MRKIRLTYNNIFLEKNIKQNIFTYIYTYAFTHTYIKIQLVNVFLFGQYEVKNYSSWVI